MNSVKAFQTLEIALPEPSGRKSATIVATVSSDGFINLYDIADVPEKPSSSEKIHTIEPLTSYDSKGTRLTCVTLADGDIASSLEGEHGKRKRGDEDEDDESDNEDGEIGSEQEEDISEEEGEEGSDEDEEEEEEELEGEEESD